MYEINKGVLNGDKWQSSVGTKLKLILMNAICLFLKNLFDIISKEKEPLLFCSFDYMVESKTVIEQISQGSPVFFYVLLKSPANCRQ